MVADVAGENGDVKSLNNSNYDSWRIRPNRLTTARPNHLGRIIMAKGQQKKSKEARKPKKEKPKTIAANPSSKGLK
jgi:hypothetical protein